MIFFDLDVTPFFKIVNLAYYPLLLLLLLPKIQTSWIYFIGLIGIVFGIKLLVKRKRPDGKDTLSFPSGHSAAAWFVVPLYSWNPLVLLWALLVSISRVVLRRHYITDVLAGGLLGAIFGIYTHRHPSL